MRLANYRGTWAWAILAMACGAENGVADAQGGGGATQDGVASEPTATTFQALDADGDHPVVVASDDYANGGEYLAAIDVNGNLREQLFTETYDNDNGWVVNWGSWSTIDGGLTGVPTMYVYPDTTAVDMYARAPDSKLWEYFRYNYGGDIVSFDVSSWSGFGSIGGSPVIVDWGDDSSLWQISVAVTDGDGYLYTLDYDNSIGWTAHPVLDGSSIIKTTHTIQAVNRFNSYNPYTCPTCGHPDAFFAGRGLSDSDTTTAWIAYRPHGSFGSSFVKLVDFTGTSSSPYVWGNDDDTSGAEFVYARFGTQLNWAYVTEGPLNWHVASNCSAAGSPGFNGIRGTNGHLLSLNWASGNLQCTDMGEGLSSAPYGWEYANNFIFFRGSSGSLWAKSMESGSAEYGDHWNLGIAIP